MRISTISSLVVIPFRIIESDIDKPRRRRTSEKTPRKIVISELLRDVSERGDENEDGEEGEEDGRGGRMILLKIVKK